MTKDLRSNALAEEYLAELGRSAAALPVNRREELLADVRSHIAVARAEAEVDDDAAITRIIGQLGDPEVIVAAALADLPAQRPPLSADRQEPPSEAVERCDVDHPQSWTLGECADGIDSRSFACVVCVRMLETRDHEVLRLTVARDGSGVTLERGVGFELADLQSALRR